MFSEKIRENNATDLALVFEARSSLEHLLQRAGSMLPLEMIDMQGESSEFDEQLRHRFPAENDALKLCVASAQALLRVSELLIDARAGSPPLARAKRLEDLVTHTKVAGRGAYQAALLLTDPQARLDAH